MPNQLETEELVLKEALVSATGLDSNVLQIGLKGDPSLRETALLRERYDSDLDKIYGDLQPALEDLLINHSPYHIFIGFNNAEIRTRSIFDPLREEIHEASKLMDKPYIDRHFPEIPYDEKIQAMRELYDYVLESKYFNRVPEFWKNIFCKRHKAWHPMTTEEIKTIFQTLGVLRNMEDYYLRNVTISIVQSVVRMQFNCDGTQFVKAKDFKQFIEENLP
ncbi:MAG TPA: hypothetical protein EYP51_05600 [Thiotrichales bacterium]|nr:hypothetical protein [Thiotrichales bacterium]